MRTITDHVANPVNDLIKISAVDEPGAGGANHEYDILIGAQGFTMRFQNGPIAENGINGVTQEVLLAIVIDRLRSFQAGPFACDENAEALAHAENSLECLKERTRSRMKRGVEGRSVA
jgi:hypothetical protein